LCSMADRSTGDGVIEAVRRVVKSHPLCAWFFRAGGADPQAAQRLEDLPVTDKDFLLRLLRSIPLHTSRMLLPSSGTTGRFSFGAFSAADLDRSARSVDDLLCCLYEAGRRKTLLLNLLPGSVPLSSSVATVVPVGVRIDSALATLEEFGVQFEQVILVGEPLFLKALLEEGAADDIVWEQMPLKVLVGGEWISESYRNYLESLVGAGRAFSHLGMAELGLTYFWETVETAVLRAMLAEDEALRKALFGQSEVAPLIFCYSPSEVHVEVLGKGGEPGFLLLTTLQERLLPLVRYRSGDRGMLLVRKEVNRVLDRHGRMPFLDEGGLPLLAHFGRAERAGGVSPEQVKEVLYSSFDLAAAVTGAFRLQQEGGVTMLWIQLKPGQRVGAFREGFRKAFAGLPVKVRVFEHGRYPAPLDFGRKVSYVGRVEG